MKLIRRYLYTTQEYKETLTLSGHIKFGAVDNDNIVYKLENDKGKELNFANKRMRSSYFKNSRAYAVIAEKFPEDFI